MAEDINDYRFDFKVEAERFLQDTIAHLNKVLFVEMRHPATEDGRAGQPEVVHKIGTQRVSDKRLSKAFNKHFSVPHTATLALRRVFRRTSYIIVINDKEDFTYMLGEKHRQALSLFSLYHEAGHSLVPNGLKTTTATLPDEVGLPYPVGECAADAYAALRFFQRFGDEAKPLLSMISWLRAYLEQADHLTTTVLDKVISDSATQNFSRLSPQQTVDLARIYAMELTPQPEMLAAYQEILDDKNNVSTSDIVEACLSPSSDDFLFYIGAKVAQPHLHHDGLIRDGKLLQWGEEKLAAVAAAIEKRDGKSLPAVLEDDKKPTFKETLSVALPRSQEKIVFNW